MKYFKLRYFLAVVFLPLVFMGNRPPIIPGTIPGTLPPGTTPYVFGTVIERYPYIVNQTKASIQINELEFYFISDAHQQREELIPDEILMKVALNKAKDMATRNYYGHVSPDGVGANTLVEQSGYELPDYYNHSLSGNNIESLMNSTDDARYVWQAWLNSEGHRMHVLGEHPEFKKQTHYGIGYAENLNSSYQHFWVIITAPPPN